MTEQFSQEPHRTRSGYDPNQPRVPAGQSSGGQWTDADGNDPAGAPNRKIIRDTSGEEAWSFYYNQYRPDSSLAEQIAFNRDRSRIISEFSKPDGGEGWDERHTVITPDGGKLTFETSGDTQTIYDAEGRPLSATTWTEHGPEAQPVVQQAFLAAVPPAVAASIELGLILLTWLSSRNGPDGTAVFAFRADAYRMPDDDSLPQKAMFVGRLSEEEVGRACPKLGIVQEETTKAAGGIDPKDFDTPAAYGTAVHTNLRRQIIALNDPDLSSEVSLLKTLGRRESAHYHRTSTMLTTARKVSIRLDILERTETDTACVHDVKTGKRRLYPGRTREIARTVRRRYPCANGHRHRGEATALTTARQVKKLVAPLLERHADLELIGRIVVLRPVHHILRGIVIDRTSEADRFNPRWALTELFTKLDYFPLGLGGRLYQPYSGLWLLSDPKMSGVLVEVTERDALPKLRAIETLQDFLEFQLPKDPKMLKYYWGPRFMFSIALGDLDVARGLLAEEPGDASVRMLDRHMDGLGSRLREQGARISSDDRAALARFLHEEEAYTVAKLKVGHVWQSTPFPLQRQAGGSR